MICQINGFEPISISGFGLIKGSSCNLVPVPPAKILTFMNDYLNEFNLNNRYIFHFNNYFNKNNLYNYTLTIYLIKFSATTITIRYALILIFNVIMYNL